MNARTLADLHTGNALRHVSDLPTPSLLLDAGRLEHNVRTMTDHVRILGVRFRPHFKTAKCREVLDLISPQGKSPVTVSTLAEADHLIDNGYTDILYAVGVEPAKLERIANLQRNGVILTLLADQLAQIDALAQAAKKFATRYRVTLEIDCDGHRGGIDPLGPELMPIVTRALSAPGVELAGVLTHAGESYNATTVTEIAAAASVERASVVNAAELIRQHGADCEIVSVGSTPTVKFATDLQGVTEARAGVFVFYDLVMAGLGVCRIDDIALSVLASVIGHQRSKGVVLIDAGWTSLSRDRGTEPQKVDQGYGLVCDLDGTPLGDLIVTTTNQEHGIVADRNGRPINLAQFPVGRRLRILPNHACATASAHPGYHVVDDRGQIAALWERARGW